MNIIIESTLEELKELVLKGKVKDLEDIFDKGTVLQFFVSEEEDEEEEEEQRIRDYYNQSCNKFAP